MRWSRVSTGPLAARACKNVGWQALAVGLGAASGLSFAPHGIWPLMLCAFAASVVYLDSRPSPSGAALFGWLLGLGQYVISLSWITEAFTYQQQLPVSAGLIAVLLLCSYLALFSSIAFALAAWAWTPGPSRIVILAALWTAGEWLRGNLVFGFPWNMTSQIWFDTPIVLQFARYAGAYGLTFATVMVFASVALWRSSTRQARSWAGLYALIGGLIALDGSLKLSTSVDDRSDRPFVHLIQANIQQDLEFDSTRQGAILRRYEHMTAALAQRWEAGAVIWPETAVEFDVAQDAELRRRLGRLLGEQRMLILGAPRAEIGNSTVNRAYNGLLVIGRGGQISASYDKSRLVPFGEFLPGAAFFSRIGLRALAASVNRFTPGTGPTILTPDGILPFSPAICYEIIFPGELLPLGGRPAWLLNISNDAWFGRSWGPHQHFAQARLRAVEEGLPVARSTPTGISGVIDSYGRVVAKTRLGEISVLTVRIPRSQPPTLYSRLGNMPVLLMLAAIIFGAGIHRFSAAGRLVLKRHRAGSS